MTFNALNSVYMDKNIIEKLNEEWDIKNPQYFYENIYKNCEASDFIEEEMIEFLQKNPGTNPKSSEYIKENGLANMKNYSEVFPIYVAQIKCLSFPIDFIGRKLTKEINKESQLMLAQKYQLFEVYVKKDVDKKKFFSLGTKV